jgi:endonuclease/exonuclease/phosphatase family metal-dependent hydrolase
MRILSYNIHKGFSSKRRHYVLRRIRQAVRKLDPDVVFLQEVQGHHSSRSEDSSQFEYLAEGIWPHFAYGKNAVYDSGHHGNAILSKAPILMHENIDVSTTRLESRGLLHAVIEAPESGQAPLHAVCVHLGLRESDRTTQLLRLCDRIRSHVPETGPLVIAGDFNDWRLRASRILRSQLEVQEAYRELHGEHARTFPAWLPSLRLDRIYFRGLELVSVGKESGKRWRLLSDHVPVVAEFG